MLSRKELERDGYLVLSSHFLRIMVMSPKNWSIETSRKTQNHPLVAKSKGGLTLTHNPPKWNKIHNTGVSGGVTLIHNPTT
jgi:hypothetical protein